jgi:plastocyanin
LIAVTAGSSTSIADIKGTVSVPATKASTETPKADDAKAAKPDAGKADDKKADDKKGGESESAKADEKRGVVVWVEGITDVKVPDKKPTLSQKDGQFSPRLMVVVAGQTVEMPNDDNIAHNVFSMSATKKFNLGIYPKGESKEVTFEKPGVIDLFCSLHRHMHAQIIVSPSQYFAVAAPDEEFTIKGVPAGTYKVTAYSNGCAQQTIEVKVPDTGDAKATFALKEADKKTQASAETTK